MLSSSGSSLNGANVYGEQLAGAKPPSRRQRLGGHLNIGATGGLGDAPGQDHAGGPADDAHLSDHLSTSAHLLSPNNPVGAKAWVEEQLEALLAELVGAVLVALKRMRPWQQPVRDALAQLIGYIERERARIRYQELWYYGLAIGSSAVEGACKHVI